MKPLEGRTALVTGGTRGIGAAVSRKLQSWGAAVTAGYVDRSAPARALADELGITVVQADITDADDLARLVAAASRDDRLDIVVHCAAAATYGPATEQSDRAWNFTQDATLDALRQLARLTRPLLVAAPQPRLIAVSNTTPHRIVAGAASLAVAKAGVEALTRYLAYELAPDGIVVNAVAPGLVPTDVLQVRPGYAHTLEQEQDASPWPASRTTQASDVADVIAALCLPELGWVSGQVLNVDGGASGWAWQGRRDG